MPRLKRKKTAFVPGIVFTLGVAGVVPAIANAGCSDDETTDQDGTGAFAGVAAVAMGGFGGVAAVAMGGFGGVARVAAGGFGGEGIGGAGGAGGGMAGAGGGDGGGGGLLGVAAVAMGAFDTSLEAPMPGVEAPTWSEPAAVARKKTPRTKSRAKAKGRRRVRRG